MAGVLKVDDLRGNTSAGDITITSEGGSATQSLQQGLAKVFVHVDQTGTQSVDASLNVASITDAGVGQTNSSLTNNMDSAEYSATMSHDRISSNKEGGIVYDLASGLYKLYVTYGGNTTVDSPQLSSVAHGDLA